VSGTFPATAYAMKTAGKFYDFVTYEGADNGFMRLAGEFGNTNSDNRTARDQVFAVLSCCLTKWSSGRVSLSDMPLRMSADDSRRLQLVVQRGLPATL